MASYQSSFDASSRPEPGWKPRKPRSDSVSGNNFESVTRDRSVRRDVDMIYSSEDMDTGKTMARSRIQPPKASSQAPSTMTDPMKLPKATSGFGFRRANASPIVDNEGTPSVLKGKRSRNVLRRKQSLVAQDTSYSETATEPPVIEIASIVTISPRPSGGSFDRSATRNEQYSFKSRQERQPSDAERTKTPQVIPELDRYRSYGANTIAVSTRPTERPFKLSTHDLPPPTPGNSALSGQSRFSASGYSGSSAYTASPATRYTESPGPGPYSRDTTPTSISSQSPGIMGTTLRMTPRLVQMQASPHKSRPPLSRRRTGSLPGEVEVTAPDFQGLPSLRESSVTSSSSGSTTKNASKSSGLGKKEKKKKKNKLSTSPPSPPPRKSSQKFLKTSDGNVVSPTKSSKSPARPVMSPASDTELTSLSRVTTTSSITPARPSRENTPSLGPQFWDSPVVIQSNLTSIQMSPERRRSSSIGYASIAESSQSNPPSRVPVRGYSPSPSQPLHRQATPAPAGLGIVPDLKPLSTSQLRQPSASRSPSPASSTSGRPRFGFFGRRTKTAPDAIPTADSKDKGARKGPAAGTGHEGYGRYAMRGRSNSAVGRERSQSGASSSQDSCKSQLAHDPFLLQRMSPVIIAGGGEIIENRNSESVDLARSESNLSLPISSRPSMESGVSSKSNLGKDTSRATMWPSGLPTNLAAQRSSTSVSKGYLTSNDEASLSSSSLAIRRSMNRLDKENEKFRLPAPIKVTAGGASPAMGSRDMSLKTDGTSKSSSSRKSAKKLTKRPSSPRKWNIFKRSNKEPSPVVDVALPVVVAVTPDKHFAHYEMMDSSEELNEEPMSIEDILRDADVVDISKIRIESPGSSNYASNLLQETNTYDRPMEAQRLTPDSLPLLAIPKMWMEVGKPTLEPEPKVPADIPRTGRPSRLPQVGRIPKVVSARPEQTSPKSFSRPFARVSMIQPVPNLSVIDRQSIALGPSPERSPDDPSRRAELQDAAAVQRSKSPEHQRAFLVISPRKDSVATTSSSSQSVNLPSITAIIPEANAALEQDEVWDEYDDLIGSDDVKVPVSATSSHGIPFQYESYESRRMGRQQKTKESPVVVEAPLFLSSSKPGTEKPPRLQLTSSSVYSPDLSAKVKEALGSLPTPLTPFSPSSFGDFIAGYGERNNSVTGSGGDRRSSAPSLRASRPASISSKPASTSSSRDSQDSKSKKVSRKSKGSPRSDLNLRISAMSVSKWLTFGHVLFNPARDDFISARSGKYHNILVIDGLGNDDWSFYAAETYPAATFYNLSPTAPQPTMPLSPDKIASLTNHKQIQHLSLTARIPYPEDFFSCVVIRFPAAHPDALLKHLIADSKRVLKPAGYVELSILDLDMVNMGTRCRRALRALKTQLTTANPSLSLGSASDAVLREIGTRGFADIKSCRVGVPVASIVRDGNGASSDRDKDVSLADMMRDESQNGDNSITKMVAKVGRWWWSRCYEGATGTDTSMWADEKLLLECEKWSTSFKLLVCYAQKPAPAGRRIASV